MFRTPRMTTSPQLLGRLERPYLPLRGVGRGIAAFRGLNSQLERRRLPCNHICFVSGLMLMFLIARGTVTELPVTGCRRSVLHSNRVESGHPYPSPSHSSPKEAGARGARRTSSVRLKALEMSESSSHGRQGNDNHRPLLHAPPCSRKIRLRNWCPCCRCPPASSWNQDAKDYSNKRIHN